MHQFFLLLCSFVFLSGLSAQVELTFTEIASGISNPTAIEAPADSSNRLFVAEKEGRIRVINLATNTVQFSSFLNIGFKISSVSERGLLGLAFHPNFAENGQFFVHYSSSGNDSISVGSNVISRFVMDDPSSNFADVTTETILFHSPQDFSNHNGGDLLFGPDGLLYFTIGDGGGGGDPNDNAQNPMNMMGTIARINVDSTSDNLPYAIPADNPFADGVGGLPEIFSFGWRNPWRVSFDRFTGDLWVGDVGQNAREEIDFIPVSTGAGLNYGWDCREGDIAYGGSSSSACDPNGDYIDPIVSFSHSSNTMRANSLTGGYVYRGTEWPELYGTYICADFVTNNFFSVTSDSMGGWDVAVQSAGQIPGVSTFGESESGELYVASLYDNKIYQIGGGVNNTRDFFNTADFEVAVFPNPAKRKLQVRFENMTNDQLLKVRLVDVAGQLIQSHTWSLGAGTETQEMNLPKLPAGTYQLMITNASGGKVIPVVILP